MKKMLNVLLFCMLISLLINVNSVSSQMSITSMTLSPFNPHSGFANISYVKGSTVNYTTTLTVTKPPAVGVVLVTIDGECTGGYQVTVDPAIIIFTAPGDMVINVSVLVPARSPLNTETVKITAKAESGEGDEKITKTVSATGQLEVGQYYFSPHTVLYMHTYDDVTYNITITNLGNGNDTYYVKVIDVDNLARYGLDIPKPTSDKLELAPNETGSLFVKVTHRVRHFEYYDGGIDIQVFSKGTGGSIGTTSGCVHLPTYWDDLRSGECLGMTTFLVVLVIIALLLLRSGTNKKRKVKGKGRT